MAASSGTPSKKQQLLEAAFTENLTRFKQLAEELDHGRGIAKVLVTGIKNGHGQSALHLAARKGYIDICKYLISDLGLDIDAKDAQGGTAMLLAFVQGHIDTAVYLLEKGANPNITDICGFTPLHFAAFEGHEEFLHKLLSKGVNVDALSNVGTPLQRAALRGKQGAIKILLDHHANPNLSFHGCFTALLSSIIVSSLHSVELLLKAGADPNAASCGVTPLEIAASNQETDMVRCLLKAGANPNVTSVVGQTPVEIAALTGNTEAFQILFPLTSPIPMYSDWSYGGILKHTNSEAGKIQMALKQKEKFEEAKSKGNKAFQEKDYLTATFWYTKVISADPSQATFLSNRSLCFAHLKYGGAALSDAMDCIKLKPEWPKAYYRAGAAWNVLTKFDQAADAFLKGLKLDPENKELQNAYQEAIAKSQM